MVFQKNAWALSYVVTIETGFVGLSNSSVSKIQCEYLFILSGWIRSFQGHDVDFPIFFLYIHIYFLLTELPCLCMSLRLM